MRQKGTPEPCRILAPAVAPVGSRHLL